MMINTTRHHQVRHVLFMHTSFGHRFYFLLALKDGVMYRFSFRHNLTAFWAGKLAIDVVSSDTVAPTASRMKLEFFLFFLGIQQFQRCKMHTWSDGLY